MDREAELARAGWSRRSVTLLTPLVELTALYRSLGFEIRLEPIETRSLDGRCAGCAPDLAFCRAIYTRPGSPRADRAGGSGPEP
jgi:hypothetical protein